MLVECRYAEVNRALVPVVQELLNLGAPSQRSSLLCSLAVAALQGYEHRALLDTIAQSASDENCATVQSCAVGKMFMLD
jgi:hypothetical protein